jgi:hypothetical protein
LNLMVAVVHDGRHPESRPLSDPASRALLASERSIARSLDHSIGATTSTAISTRCTR